MILFSWNIRGLGAKIKRNVLKKSLFSHDPWFVFIQETKLETISSTLIKAIWAKNDLDFCASPSIGSSGGLISLWRKANFSMAFNRCERNWIAVGGCILSSGFNCLLINIYNSCDEELRSETWNSLFEFCSNTSLPCLIMGDFNEDLAPNERGSQQIDEYSSAKFRDFINNLRLIEVTSAEGWFTWFRGNSRSKLDRVFVQAEWIDEFPSLAVTILKRSISDHCPLLLQSSCMDWGPRPFKFQDAWLSHSGCMDTIEKVWKKSKESSLMEKLKHVKDELKVWNVENFGNIDTNISLRENDIQRWDNVANIRDLEPDEIQTRAMAQLELWEWLKRKEIYWAQNSRIQWLKLGDRNTRFFHICASVRRSRNNISSLLIHDKKIEDPNTIKDEAVKYFKNLFSEESMERPTFSNLNFNKLSDTQASNLITPFSTDEIDEAVASCNPSKSPGPDGFNFNFIKSSWNLIKHDFYSIIREFWNTGKLPRGSNVAFIALIAKVESPMGFKDYRPISMVGCVYKIISKILAGRLKKVMNELVGPHQSSFIEGRQILDSILIASELFESCKRKKMAAVMIKIDFHKAFDSASWSFLDWTLSQMGFPPRWKMWISSCVSSAAASVLLNGSPSQPFKLQRGLRQGDPLPFSFCIGGRSYESHD